MTRPPGIAAERALLDFLVRLRFDDLPDDVVSDTLALILDHFTCSLLGLEMPWTQTLRAVVAPPGTTYPDAAAARIYGDDTAVTPEVAALVNGTAAHGFDLDDLHFPTMSHPGSVVIAAAVATALQTKADGRKLIAAVVAGYEPMLRTGMAAGLRYGELGWHATGVLGPLGSAAAAARLLDADGAETASRTVVDAVQLAASLGSGIKAFNEYGPGMVKRLHAGRAAESGILAARLAHGGYAGPTGALSARFGLARVLALGEEADIAALDRDLGTPYLVQNVYIKPYAACGAAHGAVQAAELLAADRPALRAEDIREVVIGSSQRALAQNSNPEPDDVMAAQYSTETAVAIALLGGAGDPRRFLAAGADPQDPARQLARRSRMKVDEQSCASYPDPNEGTVTVILTDGSRCSRRGSSSPSSSQGWDVAVHKFDSVAAARLDESRRRRVVAAVEALCEGGPVSDCMVALAAH